MKFYMYSAWERYTSFVMLEDLPVGPDVPSTQEFEVTVMLKDPLPKDVYQELKMQSYRDGRKTIDGADFPSSNLIIMSERAVDALGSLISNDGIFYPLDVCGIDEKYWMFHVTRTIDCIDESMCEGAVNKYAPEKSRFLALSKFFLDKKMIDPAVNVFKDGRYGNAYKFVSEAFYLTVKKNKLKGLLLYPEGANILKGERLIVNKSLAKEPVQVLWG